MDKRQRKKFNKFLINLLGRNPAQHLLISQKGDGWISIKELHKTILEDGTFPFVSPKLLKQHFALFKPKEFEIEEDYVRLKPEFLKEDVFSYRPSNPPEFLFFPIRPRAYFHIKSAGLKLPHGKKWNILCSSREKANLLGRRCAKEPIIAKVLAFDALNAGLEFFHAGHGVYLVNQDIEGRFIILPEVTEKFLAKFRRSEDKEKKEKSTKEAPLEDETNYLPGTYIPSLESFEKLQRAQKYQRRKGFKKKKRR